VRWKRFCCSSSDTSSPEPPRAATINSYQAHTSGNDARKRRSVLGRIRRGFRGVDDCFAPGIIMREHIAGEGRLDSRKRRDASIARPARTHATSDRVATRHVASCTFATTTLRSRVASHSIARFGMLGRVRVSALTIIELYDRVSSASGFTIVESEDVAAEVT
jgi:hypothetical protein